MCSYNELSPFLHGFRSSNLPVGDVGGDQVEESLQNHLGPVVHIVLFGSQLCQIFFLRGSIDQQHRGIVVTIFLEPTECLADAASLLLQIRGHISVHLL